MQNPAVQTAKAARDSAVKEVTQLQQEVVHLLLYPRSIVSYLSKCMLFPLSLYTVRIYNNNKTFWNDNLITSIWKNISWLADQELYIYFWIWN